MVVANKTYRNILYIVGIFFILYILYNLNRCSSNSIKANTETHKVIIPEQKGEFEKPTNIIESPKRKDSIVYKNKKIYTENPVNKVLAENYIKASDSIKRLHLYLQAIQEREVTYDFDNKDVKIEVYTKTRGEILDIKSKYTIKEKEVSVEIPKKGDAFAIYAGAEVGNNTSLDNMILKGDIGLQNRKGSIFTVSLDTRKNYYVGAKFKILTIKK